MSQKYKDTSRELITSEQLQVFDVIDAYCNVCDDITPHHIDDQKNYNLDDEISPDAVFSPAISVKECVACRESEENELKIDSKL